MATTNSEQAAALRKMAKLLMDLSDDVEAGHARYQRGAFDIEIKPVNGLDEIGARPITGKLPHGLVCISADMDFLTGQPPT